MVTAKIDPKKAAEAQAILDMAGESGEVHEYIEPGVHKIKLLQYTFLMPGSKYSGAVGPAFDFEVVESDQPGQKGRKVSRFVRLNPAISNPDKLRKALSFRKKEVEQVFTALFRAIDPDEPAPSFDQLKPKLMDVAGLNEMLGGVEIMAFCEEVTRGSDTYTNVRWANVD